LGEVHGVRAGALLRDATAAMMQPAVPLRNRNRRRGAFLYRATNITAIQSAAPMQMLGAIHQPMGQR
jgi:hypothetical protein